MTVDDRYGARQLLTDAQAAEAMPKWQLVQGRMHLVVRFADFRRAASFVTKVGEMAEDANHHPEIDIRWNRVHVALNSHDVDGLTGRDVRLASAIVPVIKIFDGHIDDGIFSETQIVIETGDRAAIRPFWAAIYGYELRGEDELVDPVKSGPRIRFLQVSQDQRERTRVHIDIVVPADQGRDRVAAALAAGGRLVTQAHAPRGWVVADAEGNEAGIRTWQSEPGPPAEGVTPEGARLTPGRVTIAGACPRRRE